MDKIDQELSNRIRELESNYERQLKDKIGSLNERIRKKDNAMEFVQNKLRIAIFNSKTERLYRSIEIPEYAVKDMIDFLQIGITS